MEETIQSMELAQNYKTVKENVTKACEQAGRSEQEVTLLAVSKTKPVDMLMDVYRAGARDFGRTRFRNWWTRSLRCLRMSDAYDWPSASAIR